MKLANYEVLHMKFKEFGKEVPNAFISTYRQS